MDVGCDDPGEATWSEMACDDVAKQRICGFQMRMEADGGIFQDDTAVNDLRFFCCDGYPDLP